jgi:hypothetical protein
MPETSGSSSRKRVSLEELRVGHDLELDREASGDAARQLPREDERPAAGERLDHGEVGKMRASCSSGSGITCSGGFPSG